MKNLTALRLTRKTELIRTSRNVLISGFRRELADSCALLGYYAANSGNFLSTFRENLSLLSSGFQNPQESKDSLSLRMGPIECPETSVRNYHYSLRNNPEERSSQGTFCFSGR